MGAKLARANADAILARSKRARLHRAPRALAARNPRPFKREVLIPAPNL